MGWETITQWLRWTGVQDVTVWQDLAFSVVLIPAIFFGLQSLWNWYTRSRPRRLLFKGFLPKDTEVLMFLAQYSAWDKKSQTVQTKPVYVAQYANPVPNRDKAILGDFYRNIDPLWAESDGECLASVYSVLGKAGKVGNARVGDLVQDWHTWSQPTISIGFNPRSLKLMQKCDPIFFDFQPNQLDMQGIKLDSLQYPNDAAVLQKTFTRNANVPVFILAGLGTTGTSAAGYFFTQHSIEIGRLYGSRPFCLLLTCKTDEGPKSAVLTAAYPKPPWHRAVRHLRTYRRFREKFVSPPEQQSIAETS